jgi:hypothetical protein
MIVAAIADCAVGSSSWSSRSGKRAGRLSGSGPAALVAPACFLFLITAASVVYKTAVLRGKITGFETAQSMIAFLLWMGSLLFLAPQVGGRIVGVICLVCAAACYAGAFGLFRGAPEPRNFHVFAIWSAGLLLAGILLSFPHWRWPFLLWQP